MNASRIWSDFVGVFVALGFSLTIGLESTSLAQTKSALKDSLPPPIPPASDHIVPLKPTATESSSSSVTIIPSPEMLRVAPASVSQKSTSPPIAPSQDDPEQSAKAFIVKGQKLADDELASLKKEAESLRTRLQKVELAIARWEAVSQGLKQSDKAVFIKVDGKLKAQQPGWQPNGSSVDDELPPRPMPSSSRVMKKRQLETVRRPDSSTNSSESDDLPPPVSPADLEPRPLTPTSAEIDLPPVAPSSSDSNELPPVAPTP